LSVRPVSLVLTAGSLPAETSPPSRPGATTTTWPR
jgi:hypothetical protein